MAEAKTTKPKAAKEKVLKTPPAEKAAPAKKTAQVSPADNKKTVAAKSATSTGAKKNAKAKAEEISPALRYRMTEVAAYYIAEKHHFNGNKADYWSQAEKEINAKYPK